MSTFDKIRKEVIKMKYSDIKYLYKYVQDYIDYCFNQAEFGEVNPKEYIIIYKMRPSISELYPTTFEATKKIYNLANKILVRLMTKLGYRYCSEDVSIEFYKKSRGDE